MNWGLNYNLKVEIIVKFAQTGRKGRINPFGLHDPSPTIQSQLQHQSYNAPFLTFQLELDRQMDGQTEESSFRVAYPQPKK